MELENEKKSTARFLSCGDALINIDTIHRIEIRWRDTVNSFDKWKALNKGEPEPKNLQYFVSVRLSDGDSITISKIYSSYEEALTFYRKVLDALRMQDGVELIEVKKDE